ncbi:glycoside hydrolase family 10 protein [soil metagenome]
MKKFPLILVVTICVNICTIAQSLPEPEREFRAVWIATVDNIDFPSDRTLTIDEQKAELLRDLDLASRLNLNAVIFQVRPMADALYRSEIEPWSEYLTGEMGKPQAFDPLEFIVAEAHKRGILVHAWFNPYRAYHPSAKTVSEDHISKRRPDLVRKYGKYLWMDPTDDEVQKHSLKVILDVVKRYDIDGVHFDDYFYPYIEKDENGHDIEFPDDKNWNAYQASIVEANQRSAKNRKPLGRGDWRRMHVNNFISSVGREVKRAKPHVMYGISPFGIWKPMPELGIEGLNAYEGLYADSLKWLQEGWVDYFAPQLYWETARRAQSFPVLLKWWNEQNIKSRHIWPGLASYRIGRNENWPVTELTNQIKGIRASKSTAGEIYFNFKSLRNNQGGVQNELLQNSYQHKAIIPASPWIKTKRPLDPKVTITRIGDLINAKWKPANNAFWYLVYAKDKTGWSYSVLPSSERSISLSNDIKIEKVIVKSVDRLGNISN